MQARTTEIMWSKSFFQQKRFDTHFHFIENPMSSWCVKDNRNLNQIFNSNNNGNLTVKSLQKMFEYELFFDKNYTKFYCDVEFLWTRIVKWSKTQKLIPDKQNCKQSKQNIILNCVKPYFIPIFQRNMNVHFLKKYVLWMN